MPSRPEITESALCCACAMCCDNTLYGRVVIEAEEAVQLRALGIEVIEYDDGELSFDQPCPRIRKGICEVYEDRPWTCQSYVCETINAMRDDKIDAEEAKARVDMALAAKAELGRVIGTKDMFETRRALTDAIAEKGRKAKLPPYAPQVFALERILDRWFRTDEYKTMTNYDG